MSNKSNLATRFITTFAKDSNAKLGQKVSKLGHVTYFLTFGTPPYLRNCWS